MANLEATLPGSYYTGPEHFSREVEHILQREWFCVGRASTLSAGGDYLAVNVAGESILIVRDEHGDLHGFYNVCRHRGTQLVAMPDSSSVQGTFSGVIRCPYHAWSYALDGALRGTPHLEVATDGLGLHTVQVDTWGGFVFARLCGAGADLSTALGAGTERVSRYPLAQLQVGASIRYEVQANWKVILENYNECYHCAGVHPELCALVPEFRRGGGSGLDWDRGIAHREGAYTFTLDGTTGRAGFPGLNADELVRHKGELFYPNLMLSLSMDHVAAFLVWPRSAGHSTVCCDFLFYPGEMHQPGFDPGDAVDFWDMTNRQDWAICESVQRGMGSRVFDTGFCAPMEDLSLDIRNYVRSRLDLADQLPDNKA